MGNDYYTYRISEKDNLGYRENFAEEFINKLENLGVEAKSSPERNGGYIVEVNWRDIHENLFNDNSEDITKSNVRSKIKEIIEEIKNEGYCPHPNEHDSVSRMEKSKAVSFGVSIPLKGGIEFGRENTELVLVCESCALVVDEI